MAGFNLNLKFGTSGFNQVLGSLRSLGIALSQLQHASNQPLGGVFGDTLGRRRVAFDAEAKAIREQALTLAAERAALAEDEKTLARQRKTFKEIQLNLDAEQRNIRNKERVITAQRRDTAKLAAEYAKSQNDLADKKAVAKEKGTDLDEYKKILAEQKQIATERQTIATQAGALKNEKKKYKDEMAELATQQKDLDARKAKVAVAETVIERNAVAVAARKAALDVDVARDPSIKSTAYYYRENLAIKELESQIAERKTKLSAEIVSISKKEKDFADAKQKVAAIYESIRKSENEVEKLRKSTGEKQTALSAKKATLKESGFDVNLAKDIRKDESDLRAQRAKIKELRSIIATDTASLSAEKANQAKAVNALATARAATIEDEKKIAAARQDLANKSKALADRRLAHAKTGGALQGDLGKANASAAALKRFYDEVGALGGQTILTAFAFQSLASSISTAIQPVIDITAHFQMLKASLETTFGKDAEIQFRKLQDFAKTTPFQLTELTDGFNRLSARGLFATTQELRKMGDFASATRKPFNQLVEAIADGANRVRWREFGVKTQVAGDKMTLSFKGFAVTVKNSMEGAFEAVKKFGEMEGVAGGMERQAKTMGGALSNLKDQVDITMAFFGERIASTVVGTIDWFKKFLQSIQMSGELGVLANMFSNTANAISKTGNFLAFAGHIFVSFIAVTVALKLAVQTVTTSILILGKTLTTWVAIIVGVSTAWDYLTSKMKETAKIMEEINTKAGLSPTLLNGVENLTDGFQALNEGIKSGARNLQAMIEQLEDASVKGEEFAASFNINYGTKIPMALPGVQSEEDKLNEESVRRINAEREANLKRIKEGRNNDIEDVKRYYKSIDTQANAMMARLRNTNGLFTLEQTNALDAIDKRFKKTRDEMMQSEIAISIGEKPGATEEQKRGALVARGNIKALQKEFKDFENIVNSVTSSVTGDAAGDITSLFGTGATEETKKQLQNWKEIEKAYRLSAELHKVSRFSGDEFETKSRSFTLKQEAKDAEKAKIATDAYRKSLINTLLLMGTANTALWSSKINPAKKAIDDEDEAGRMRFSYRASNLSIQELNSNLLEVLKNMRAMNHELDKMTDYTEQLQDFRFASDAATNIVLYANDFERQRLADENEFYRQREANKRAHENKMLDIDFQYKEKANTAREEEAKVANKNMTVLANAAKGLSQAGAKVPIVQYGKGKQLVPLEGGVDFKEFDPKSFGEWYEKALKEGTMRDLPTLAKELESKGGLINPGTMELMKNSIDILKFLKESTITDIQDLYVQTTKAYEAKYTSKGAKDTGWEEAQKAIKDDKMKLDLSAAMMFKNIKTAERNQLNLVMEKDKAMLNAEEEAYRKRLEQANQFYKAAADANAEFVAKVRKMNQIDLFDEANQLNQKRTMNELGKSAFGTGFSGSGYFFSLMMAQIDTQLSHDISNIEIQAQRKLTDLNNEFDVNEKRLSMAVNNQILELAARKEQLQGKLTGDAVADKGTMMEIATVDETISTVKEREAMAKAAREQEKKKAALGIQTNAQAAKDNATFEATEARRKARIQAINDGVQSTAQMFNSIMDAAKAASQATINLLDKEIGKRNQLIEKMKESADAASAIGRDFNAKQLEVEKERVARLTEEKKKETEQLARYSQAQAAANLIVGITSTLAQPDPTGGILNALKIAALFASYYAGIAQAREASRGAGDVTIAAEGGMIQRWNGSYGLQQGNKHSSGGITSSFLEHEAGEFIMPATKTKEFLPQLKAMYNGLYTPEVIKSTNLIVTGQAQPIDKNINKGVESKLDELIEYFRRQNSRSNY